MGETESVCKCSGLICYIQLSTGQNDVLKNALRFTGRLLVLASEEEDTPVSLENYDQMYTRRADVVVEEGNKVRQAGSFSQLVSWLAGPRASGGLVL